MFEKIKPKARHKARRFAVQALYQWQLSGNSLNFIEQQFNSREDVDLTKVDMLYFQELLHAIPADLNTFDELLKPYLDRDLESLGYVELAILRIGCYELVKRLDIPYKVVLNEAIELAKSFGADESYKYVNGVLNKLAGQLRTAE
jgi:N utilization substance protein B